MRSLTQRTFCGPFVATLLAATGLADPPDVRFPAGSSGLNVPMDNDIAVDGFGVATFLGDGFSNDGIAARFFVSGSTVMPVVVDHDFTNGSMTPSQYGRDRARIGDWHVVNGASHNPGGGQDSDRIAYRSTVLHNGSPTILDDMPTDAVEDWIVQFDFSYSNAGVPGSPIGPHDFFGTDLVDSIGADTGDGIGIAGPHATQTANLFRVKQTGGNQNIATFSLPTDTTASFMLHYKADTQAVDFWMDSTRIVDGHSVGGPRGFKQIAFGSGDPYNAHLRIDNLLVTTGGGGVASNLYARYHTAVEGQGTPTAMPVNQDWVAKIAYKHTGGYGNHQFPFALMHAEDDKRMIALRNDSGDSWSLLVGNGSGGWDVASGQIALDVYWNTFIFHYKSSTQTIEGYLNNTPIATDLTTGHGRYDVNYAEVNYTGAGTDWFGEVRIGSSLPAVRPTTFGHDWVRSKPFSIQGLVSRPNSLNDTRYRDANFTQVLVWETEVDAIDKAWQVQSLPWHWHTQPQLLGGAFMSQIHNWMNNYPGGEGMLVWDEPVRTDFADVKEVTDWLRGAYPNLLVYGNLSTILPPSGNYGQEYDTPFVPGVGHEDPPVPYDYDIFVDDYLYVVSPDVLKFALYPFKDDPGGETTEEFLRDRSYFRGCEVIRAAGLRANIPTFLFVQSYDAVNTYLSSESDLRMEVFSALAYGFKGLSYFIFDHWEEFGSGDGGLLTATDPCTCLYATNALYTPAQTMNLEIEALGETLKYLESTRVRYVPGTHIDSGSGMEVPNDLPLAVTPSDPQTDSLYMQSIQATNVGTIADVTAGDLLIGYFAAATDELAGLQCDADEYFMIVNLLRERDVSAADASQQVRIDFDFGVSGITRLLKTSRVTGNWEAVPLIHSGGSSYALEKVFSGGTGELFKYDNGCAPRITSLQGSAGNAVANFLSCSGIVYHVEETLDPTADPVVWTESATVSNFSGVAAVTNPAGSADSGIYRLRGSQ